MKNITSSTTHNVDIQVETWYHDEASSPGHRNFVFAYQITIVNSGMDTIQLLSREWKIKDAGGDSKIVKGLGVVGEQPILRPGERHTYISGCNFRTELGSMEGFYIFRNVGSERRFKVRIPKFILAFPFTLN